MFYFIIYFVVFLLAILLDQGTKIVVDAFDSNIKITDFFYINNTRNSGAAFSFLNDKPWAQTFFIALTAVILLGIVLYAIFTKSNSRFMHFCLALILGGAVGNLIDRIAFGYVRDFIELTFFANFNVADIFVCVGAFLLVIYYLFIDEEAIFKRKSNKKE